MERLTSNKNVSDMSMIELAHNSCYADNERNARYRDYEMDMDARDFARNLMVTLTKDELPISDTEFEEEILDDLAIDPFSDVRGLIALFYRNLWAMANLRETLKKYEDLEERLNKVYGECDGLLLRVVEMLEKHPCIDVANNTLKSRLLTDEDVDKWEECKQLEEQGRLIKLPCKVGDTVYVKMAQYCKTHYAEAEVKDFVHFISCGFCIVVTSKYFDKQNIPFSEFGKTVFLTKSEVEAKLKELRGNND